MGLKEIKKMKADKGFTIVELLIVIVVIGILAAIVIVAYQGVTSRANASKAQTNAVTVQKKAEAYNADTSGGNGQYPATATAFASLASSSLGAVPAGISVIAADPAPANNNTTTAVRYVACTAGGQVVGYYVDYYDQSKSALVYIVGGTTIAAGANSTTAPTTTGCTLSTT